MQPWVDSRYSLHFARCSLPLLSCMLVLMCFEANKYDDDDDDFSIKSCIFSRPIESPRYGGPFADGGLQSSQGRTWFFGSTLLTVVVVDERVMTLQSSLDILRPPRLPSPSDTSRLPVSASSRAEPRSWTLEFHRCGSG